MSHVVRQHLLGVWSTEVGEAPYGLADNPLGQLDDGNGSLQIVGGPRQDARVLQASFAIEQALGRLTPPRA